MSFWDASAVVPLCYREQSTDGLKVIQESDQRLTVWWGTIVECASAFARRRREQRLGRGERSALERLALLGTMWTEVGPSVALRELAMRLVRVHALRVGDALQLAAALEWGSDTAAGLTFVTLDRRLAEAARLEGFSVLPEGIQ